MKLKEAQTRAAELVAAMAPYCERIEIAGSLRREKQECRDIELVVIPKWGEIVTGTSLFGNETAQANLLHQWAVDPDCPVVWIKTGTPDIEFIVPNEEGKYWRGLLADGITKLDVFICTPQNWGAIFLIRTGSSDFSRAVVTHARHNTEYRFAGGSLTHLVGTSPLDAVSVDVPTPEENDVFDLLGLQYVEPKMRHGWDSIVRLPPSNEPNTSWIGGV